MSVHEAATPLKKRRQDSYQSGANDGALSINKPAKIEHLAELHAHSRDDRIKFDEDGHRYSIRIDHNHTYIPIECSVTTYIQRYKEPFEEDEVIKRMLNNSSMWVETRPEYCISCPDGTLRPMTRDEIKNEWEVNRTNAANNGTYMHHLCELLMSDPRTMAGYIDELRNFFNFYEEYLLPLKAETYRLEWRIFDEQLSIAGFIDYVGKLPDGSFVLVDWKRSRRLREDGFNGSMMKEPFTMLPDSNVGHYTLQLNMYKLLLLRNYGDMISSIKKMYIAGFHPACAKTVEVADLGLHVLDGTIMPCEGICYENLGSES